MPRFTALRFSNWTSLDFWTTWLGAIAVIAGAFWLASHYIQPAPPKRIVMTVGPEGGAYEGFAQDFQQALAENGIQVELRTTQGGREDLRLLNDPKSGVTLAVVQGGLATEEDGVNLMSLAALYREPVWVFHRRALKVSRLSDLKGKSLSIGPPESGVRTLSLQLLEANGINGQNTRLGALPSEKGADALVAGQLDALIVVGAPESALVERLMRQPGLHLLDFSQAEAYTRSFPVLSRIVLPMGAFDLGRNIPDHKVTLVAPTANLVVRDDIHPALISVIMDAATYLTGGVSMLRHEGEFPSPLGLDIPLSLDAERYMKNGPSFLNKHLPYWVAVWVDRLIVLLIPLVAVLLPVMKLAPSVYAWRVKSRIYRWYGELKLLEYDLDRTGSKLDIPAALVRLDEIEHGASKIRTPLAYSEHLYNLRAHIDLVRQRLGTRPTASA